MDTLWNSKEAQSFDTFFMTMRQNIKLLKNKEK